MDIKKGINHKPASSDKLIAYFKSRPLLEGHLYIGYPILATGENSITIDALWLSPRYGIVIFDLVEGTQLDVSIEEQDHLYDLLDSYLRVHSELKQNRKDLAVNIEVLSFAPACSKDSINNEAAIAIDNNDLDEFIKKLEEWVRNNLFEKVLSVIQSVVSLPVKGKRTYVKSNDSKGAKLKNLEDTIATLDADQEEAIIEYYDGLQRLRGLAGSGKTIVLALKAAYLHAQNENWKIAIIFNTRSLKDQFKTLISKFFAEKSRKLPDWNKIQIINAWGSSKDKENEKGFYYQICTDHGIEFLDFRTARNYNSKNPTQDIFETVCQKALSEIKKYHRKYDAILVDEAQDLSESFLKLCFNSLNEPKRLIYAYDELQKLNEGSSLRGPTNIFGREARDTILKKCYRNSRPILVTAHALGFGVYRRNLRGDFSMVQFFDQPQLWREVGYEIKEGTLQHGSHVRLYRPEGSSPKYLETHSAIDDLLVFKSFEKKEEQAAWIAQSIENDLTKEELLPSDIIVINPIGLTTKDEVSTIRNLLFEKNIKSHIAGEFDANIFFEENSIAFTGINRAKGNEVPMVYVINAQDCYSSGLFESQELIKRRNILFTAITRSKAWVRVCGIGARMGRLIEEFEEVKQKNFELDFTYPTKEEIERMNIIHRDLAESEKTQIQKEVGILKEIPEIIGRIRKNEAYIEDYPIEIQEILNKLL